MSFAVVTALGFGTVGAILALTRLAPSAVALAAFGLLLAWRARRRAKFMNESTQMPTVAVALNAIALGLAALAVAQFGAVFLWTKRSDNPQVYDFKKALDRAIAPTTPADLGTRDLHK